MKLENLVRLRKAKKMSQELISGLVGVSMRTYASWESGERDMRASDLKRISEILNVSMEDILGGMRHSVGNPEFSMRHSVGNPPLLKGGQGGIVGEAHSGYAAIPPPPSAVPLPLTREAPPNIEIEVELPSRSRVRFSVPGGTIDERLGRLIHQITEEKEEK